MNTKKITEHTARPKLIALHYFSVDPLNTDLAQELGMRQDRHRKWYMREYNTSGAGFNQKFAIATSTFGRKTHSVNLE